MTYKKKLIEVALPLATINAESAREKSIRHGHPSTLHLWWARRPLASARAVLWASLVDDPSAHPDKFPTEADQEVERKRLFDILERLVPWEATTDQRVLAEARAEILRSCDGKPPLVLDPFGGGGTIPLESLRLGLPTASGDLNPVAVTIQRAMLEVPTRFAGRPPVSPSAAANKAMWDGAQGLAADIEAWGRWMGEEAARLIGSHYPPVKAPDGSLATPIAWIWVRTVESPDPSWSGHVPLVGSWVLSKKPRRPVVWVEPIVDTANRSIRYEVRKGGMPEEGTVGRSGGRCLATGTPIPLQYIRDEAKAGRLGNALIAVVAEGTRSRLFCDPPDDPVGVPPVDSELVPEGNLPDGGLGFRVQNYGMTEWKSLFTSRQLLALTTFGGLLRRVRAEVEDGALAKGLADDGVSLAEGGCGARAYAEALVTYLALIIDRCAGRWTHLAIWNSVRDTVEHVFRLQAIQMTWAFAEANPFSSSTGNWVGQIEWVTKALLTLPIGQTADVAQRDARARMIEKAPFMLCTDPPYYDNVGYADLSDFFYVWMRKNLRDVWPDECATLLAPKADELIADPSRAGGSQAALAHFEEGMGEAFAAASQSSHPDFPSTIFYAFKASETTADGTSSTGWETFLSGLLEAGLAITATWPMRTEMTGGVRNARRNSLASSVVLACRPRHVTAPMATRGEFIGALRSEMDPAVRLLQFENIAPVDLAQSAIGPGIAIFSRYAKVIEADGKAMTVRAALGLINEVLSEVLSGEESEFDADTRFALTWFEQFGHNPGPFGDADLLARAKDTTVAGVAQAGVVASRDGKVRLVDRSDLPADWDPASDSRLTVWETTQYLIRSLESSESEAAALLARMGGGVGERARQLAYLLYGICDRKKWAAEAAAYNMLVTAWPEISRLAAAGPAPEATGSFAPVAVVVKEAAE